MNDQTTGLQGYYPEMGDKCPDAKIHASLCHYGRHWYLRAAPDVTIKGRGVRFIETETAEKLVPGSKFIGWNRYCVTERAFESICKSHKVASEFLL